jgi:prevent-host-death family protein
VEIRVSATEARVRFGELMRQAVEGGQPIIVERGGKAHVVVLSMDAYERLFKGQGVRTGRIWWIGHAHRSRVS